MNIDRNIKQNTGKPKSSNREILHMTNVGLLQEYNGVLILQKLNILCHIMKKEKYDHLNKCRKMFDTFQYVFTLKRKTKENFIKL